MRKYPWYLDGAVVENENWEEYSLNVLEQIRTSTLKYYENLYDIFGMIKTIVNSPGNKNYKTDGVYSYCLTSDRMIARVYVGDIGLSNVVYDSEDFIFPGDWLENLVVYYEKIKVELDKLKEQQVELDKQKLIKKYFRILTDE